MFSSLVDYEFLYFTWKHDQVPPIVDPKYFYKYRVEMDICLRITPTLFLEQISPTPSAWHPSLCYLEELLVVDEVWQCGCLSFDQEIKQKCQQKKHELFSEFIVESLFNTIDIYSFVDCSLLT